MQAMEMHFLGHLPLSFHLDVLSRPGLCRGCLAHSADGTKFHAQCQELRVSSLSVPLRIGTVCVHVRQRHGGRGIYTQ